MVEPPVTATDLLGVEPREVMRELLQRAKLDVLSLRSSTNRSARTVRGHRRNSPLCSRNTRCSGWRTPSVLY